MGSPWFSELRTRDAISTASHLFRKGCLVAHRSHVSCCMRHSYVIHTSIIHRPSPASEWCCHSVTTGGGVLNLTDIPPTHTHANALLASGTDRRTDMDSLIILVWSLGVSELSSERHDEKMVDAVYSGALQPSVTADLVHHVFGLRNGSPTYDLVAGSTYVMHSFSTGNRWRRRMMDRLALSLCVVNS